MLDRDQAGDIFGKLRRLSQADEIELLISGGRSALTRFANNTIHQNVAEEEYHISVRSAFGNRTARASTNKHDDDSLRRVVQSSEALAKVQHPDPDLLPMIDARGPLGPSVPIADMRGRLNEYGTQLAALAKAFRENQSAVLVLTGAAALGLAALVLILISAFGSPIP